MTLVPLAEAESEQQFGGKAASLARAMRASLPVPDGFAISWDHDDAAAIANAFHACGERVAMRSSAVGEDSLDASFAGQHVTVLNVTDEQMLQDAVITIRESARTESALAYRAKMGIAGEPRIGIVMMRMIDPDVAGVLFTRNPMTGAHERVIESAWGLGEAVVAGLVTPDRFRISERGEILERTVGRKDIAVRFASGGGTSEEPVAAQDIDRPSLTDEQLHALHELAARCETHFGGPQDLEFAFEKGELFLLQSRPITRAAIAPAPAQPSTSRAETPALTTRRFVGLGLAALLAPLNSTIIAVALPTITGAFATTPALTTRWLVTAYLVVTIVAQSPAGKLADLLGTSRVLTLGRSMFGLGALLAAFSPSLPVLGAGRVLMALGGAFTIPTVFAFLRNSVPPERRGRIFGVFGAIMGTAAAAGPIIGGFLTARFGWHSMFFVNVPVVLLSFAFVPPQRAETRTEPRRATRFDFAGSALLAIAVLLLVAAVERTHIGFALGAIATLVTFIIHERRTSDPVLDVRLFTRAAFAAGGAIIALQNLAMYGMIYLLPFVIAGNPAATGRLLLLFTAGMVLASPIGGRLSDAIGPRVVSVAGAATATAGAWMFVAAAPLVPSLILMGAGIGIATSPSQAAAMSAIQASQAGVASGALSTMRYLGGVIASGLVALIAAGGVQRDARLMIFPAVLFISALVSL
ncbi:MAG TPA: MFS transporter, partial [Thermoanaerobaculia bacterium]|nr:MFS transporter [Thermoanaerobaculia bacterium]